MAKRVLNDRTIKASKPAKPGKRYEVADAGMPGMVVRVTDEARRRSPWWPATRLAKPYPARPG